MFSYMYWLSGRNRQPLALSSLSTFDFSSLSCELSCVNIAAQNIMSPILYPIRRKFAAQDFDGAIALAISDPKHAMRSTPTNSRV